MFPIFYAFLTFQEINEILQQQNAMATQQQEGLNKAEANLTQVNDNLDAGVTELEAARDLRRGCCGMKPSICLLSTTAYLL